MKNGMALCVSTILALTLWHSATPANGANEQEQNYKEKCRNGEGFCTVYYGAASENGKKAEAEAFVRSVCSSASVDKLSYEACTLVGILEPNRRRAIDIFQKGCQSTQVTIRNTSCSKLADFEYAFGSKTRAMEVIGKLCAETKVSMYCSQEKAWKKVK